MVLLGGGRAGVAPGRGGLGEGGAALLTSAVQAGFVAGTLASALLGLADRFDPRRFFAASALTAGAATLLLSQLPPTGWAVYGLRFLTGACSWRASIRWACAWRPPGRAAIWAC